MCADGLPITVVANTLAADAPAVKRGERYQQEAVVEHRANGVDGMRLQDLLRQVQTCFTIRSLLLSGSAKPSPLHPEKTPQWTWWDNWALTSP